ncbi:MAG: serine hydrolase [Lewinellaceae bacterium]|nr:serine hydrolase [Lewinellaceae bacterium]
MKNKFLLVLVIGWGVVTTTLAQSDAAKVKLLDQYIEQARQDWNVPGLSIAVVKDGALLFQKGYGVQRLGNAARVNPQTIFGICSTTKAMTAATMAMLVDEGKVHWDDPVVNYIPEFQLIDAYATQSIRVRDLLTHNAGLPNADFLWYGNPLSMQEIIHRLRYLPLGYPVRGGYTYQNVMYAVAGELIARVSGMSWADFVRKRIFEPLSMKNTYPDLQSSAAVSNRMTPHQYVAGKITPIENMAVDPVAPAGAVWSSVEDMAKWMLFVLDSARVNGQRLLSPESYGEWLRPQAIIPQDQFYPTAALTKPTWMTYALGWFQQDYRGKAVNFHTGSMDGDIAILGLLPSERLGVYILGNLDHAEVRHALMLKVFDLFGFPDATRDWNAECLKLYGDLKKQGEAAQAKRLAQRTVNTMPTHDLSAYAGTYTDPLFGEVEVAEVAGQLHVKLTQELQLTLTHWHYDVFQGSYEQPWLDPDLVQFQLNAAGQVKAMMIGSMSWVKKS